MLDINAFGQFIIKHWELWALLGVILVLLLIEEQKAQGGTWGAVSTQQAVQLMNHEDALVIDIRDKARFDEAHIINARHIPAAQIQDSYDALEKFQDKPIILTCDAGHSCLAVVGKMQKAGFSKAALLKGGITEWKKSGLPLTK